MDSGKAYFRNLLGTPPYIVGVVNVTPDSFSDGGMYFSPIDAIGHAERLISEGANIIELGAESTAPGADPISVDEEIARLRPVVKAMSNRTVLSIDTYKAVVAEECLELGAKIINDVSAFRADSGLPKVIARHKASVFLMHSKEKGPLPHVSESYKDYTNIVEEVSRFLKDRVGVALSAGIPNDQIAVDPGMGRFLSHDEKYSWEILRRLSELKECGVEWPILIGTSRKGFLGGKLSDRDPLSCLTSMLAVERGASFVRVHNVSMMKSFFAAAAKLDSDLLGGDAVRR